MMITATKVAVAFHTMFQTTGMSAKCTTPSSSAMTAPSEALQPIPKPRGCQMTKARVKTKMKTAVSIVLECNGLRTGVGGYVRSASVSG